jgi:hypothetical protein
MTKVLYLEMLEKNEDYMSFSLAILTEIWQNSVTRLPALPSFTSGQEEGLSLSLTTKLAQRRRTKGTILPVENVQLYRRMVASHEEE